MLEEGQLRGMLCFIYIYFVASSGYKSHWVPCLRFLIFDPATSLVVKELSKKLAGLCTVMLFLWSYEEVDSSSFFYFFLLTLKFKN